LREKARCFFKGSSKLLNRITTVEECDARPKGFSRAGKRSSIKEQMLVNKKRKGPDIVEAFDMLTSFKKNQ
jgi:hypothetical protein